jgi:hypothetical protein
MGEGDGDGDGDGGDKIYLVSRPSLSLDDINSCTGCAGNLSRFYTYRNDLTLDADKDGTSRSFIL